MDTKYCVTVLLNGEVWGTWTLPSKLMPDQETELRKLFKHAVKCYAGLQLNDVLTVEFLENIECDSFSELMEGIKESLDNEFGE